VRARVGGDLVGHCRRGRQPSGHRKRRGVDPRKGGRRRTPRPHYGPPTHPWRPSHRERLPSPVPASWYRSIEQSSAGPWMTIHNVKDSSTGPPCIVDSIRQPGHARRVAGHQAAAPADGARELSVAMLRSPAIGLAYGRVGMLLGAAGTAAAGVLLGPSLRDRGGRHLRPDRLPPLRGCGHQRQTIRQPLPPMAPCGGAIADGGRRGQMHLQSAHLLPLPESTTSGAPYGNRYRS